MPVVNAREALALLRRQGILTLTPAGDAVRSLVMEVVGEPVRGSWWAHPKGAIIFRIGEALEASTDVLVAKLVKGRTTFVHRSLWAPLVRVAADPGRIDEASRRLSPEARRLLGQVERAGILQLDRAQEDAPPEARKRTARARAELEKGALCISSSEHTDRGSHRTTLRAWSHWTPAELRKESDRLTLEEARERLARAGLIL